MGIRAGELEGRQFTRFLRRVGEQEMMRRSLSAKQGVRGKIVDLAAANHWLFSGMPVFRRWVAESEAEQEQEA